MADGINLDSVKSFFETNKDNADVQTFAASLNPLTVDRVKAFVEKDHDGTAWLDSVKDKHLAKGLETFKANNLQKLVDEAYHKQHPDADPKDTKIAALEKQFADMKAEAAHKDLTNKALQIAGEKKLPAELVKYFIGKDEDETKTNLGALEKAFTDKVNAVAEERLKGGYKPPKSNSNTQTDAEQAQTNINKLFGLK